ncbi:MAG: UDP-glucose 4-epimerase GalE [Candidatus Neomarinimicrobiota bacterium]
MKIIITGGAGYIGSHVVLAALARGYDVTVFDDLSTANRENINLKTKFIEGSINSKDDLSKLFTNGKYDAVIHLAASKASGESMLNPKKYTYNNIIGSLNILMSCIDNDIKYFIFSSSAAVYGNPRYDPIDELHPLKPSSYYGYTKLSTENSLEWFSKIHCIKYASLRYFNAAGFDIDKRITGKEKDTENLIPLIMEVAKGFKPFIPIYGNDYKTKDGTGIRDYVHVSDLAIAHISSLEYLIKYSKNLILNLGSEVGFSVLEIIERTKSILKIDIPYKIEERRVGDVAKIISSCAQAEEIIKWKKKYSELDTLIKSTWQVYNKKNIV